MKIQIFDTQIGPLEERVLHTLLKKRGATVRELKEDHYTNLAYTTVLTTLYHLFKKGLLCRTYEGKAFRYTARFSLDVFQREAVGHNIRQLLKSSSTPSLPLSFLVEALGEQDAQLLDDLRELVERKRRENG